MASTHLSLHYHIVFATKDRQRLIEPSWQPRLHDYLGGTIRGLDGHPHRIGGVADHVHILAGLRAHRPLADIVREIKRCSSLWIHEELRLRCFAWQSGYSAFTVSANARDAVMRYIENQEEHHRVTTFQDEYRALLKKHGITWDETYVWD